MSREAPLVLSDTRLQEGIALEETGDGLSCPSHPTTLAREETLMTLPLCCFIIPGTTTCASKKGARRLTA